MSFDQFREEKCRCISVMLVWLLGVASVTALIYGGVGLYRVSGDASVAEETMGLLQPFVKCQEISRGQQVSSTLNHILVRQCMAVQLPPKLLFGFAAALMILTLLCTKCAFKHDRWFGWTLWSTLAFAMVIVAGAFVAAQVLPVASQFVDCKHFNSTQVEEVQSNSFMCLRFPADSQMPDRSNALKWIHKGCAFFSGCVGSLATLILLFMIKSCCCCNPNSCCSGDNKSGCSTAAANGEHPCPIRRALHNFRSRFCRRNQSHTALVNSEDSSMPVSAPTYYEVNSNSANAEAATEDAGLSPSNQYYGVN